MSCRFRCAFLFVVWIGSGCYTYAPSADTAAQSKLGPQAFVEEQLLSRMSWNDSRRDADGGLTYVANFNEEGARQLSVPRETVERYCVGKGGTLRFLRPLGPGADIAGAESLRPAVRAILVRAHEEERQFGLFACERDGHPVWLANIEPYHLATVGLPKLSIHVLCDESPSSLAAEFDREEREVARAEERTQEPPLQRIQRWLNPTSLLGVAPGETTPEQLAEHFGLDLRNAPCPKPFDATPNAMCWSGPITVFGLPHATSLWAHFAPRAQGRPALDMLTLEFGPDASELVQTYTFEQWGPGERDEEREFWQWGDRTAELRTLPSGVRVHVTHDEGASPRDPSVRARPWGIRLGMDTFPEALGRMMREGFRPTGNCTRRYERARDVALMSCGLVRPSDRDIKDASLEYMEFADGVQVASGYSVSFHAPDERGRAKTQADLEASYGARKFGVWRVGPIWVHLHDSIEVAHERWFTVAYTHVRMFQLQERARRHHEQASDEERRRGL